MRGGFDPSRGLEAELRRLAGLEIGRALEFLRSDDLPTGRVLHETRRRFKKLRGLLRLVRHADEAFYRRQNRRFRDCARTLAAGREAGALVETVDRFLAPGPGEPDRAVLADFRDRLETRRRAIEADAEGTMAAIAGAVATCEAGREDLSAFIGPATRRLEAAVIAEGSADIVRAARRALRRAARDGETEAFHDLRKAVKYHSMHLDLLAGMWGEADARRRRAAKRLGDILGELNDLATMGEFIDVHPRLAGEAGPLMRRLMKRRDRQLRAAALRAGEKLFRERGGRTARTVARACRTAARTAANPDTGG